MKIIIGRSGTEAEFIPPAIARFYDNFTELE